MQPCSHGIVGHTHSPGMADPPLPALEERIAKAFHEKYEELAPSFGWETQEGSQTEWKWVPWNQRALMCATVRALLEEGVFDA